MLNGRADSYPVERSGGRTPISNGGSSRRARRIFPERVFRMGASARAETIRGHTRPPTQRRPAPVVKLPSLLIPLFLLIAAAGAAEPVVLVSPHGAAVIFNASEAGWGLGRLVVPGEPEGGRAIVDRSVEIATDDRQELLAPDWELVEASAERVVLEQAGGETGMQVRRIVSFGPAANVLRVETWVRRASGPAVLARVGLLDLQFEGEAFHETGPAPASFPVFGEGVFAGIEHVSGESLAAGDAFQLVQRTRLEVDETWRFVAAAVVGWPLPGADEGLPEGARMRVAFLNYLDSVRIKPERMVLHSETWWTMMPPLSEKDVLADIDALRKGFFERTGMFFDTYCLDLGWSDPRTFWQIAPARFPNEFRAVNERLGALGTRLGLWMSPGSGYTEGLNNEWLLAQNYAMTPFPGIGQVPCFAFGTRYQREFKERIVGFARQYGLGHVILDFMAQRCDVPSHGHPVGRESRYAIDAGLADVLDALRAVNPQIALEPMVCGYPPSPWWLTKTPFILGPAGDDVPYGRVASPEWMEALITARDIAYRSGQEAWLMPTQALETWDIIVQTPGEFENTAVMAIGRGRWFLSSYIKPSLMKPEDWDFFAALVRWARANKQYLGNAWMIGGKPENRDAYGFMFRNAEKDVFCVRNPWIEERGIELPASIAKEARELRMIYPRRATLARVEAGEPFPRVNLAAYETVFLETVPAGETSDVAAPVSVPQATLAANEPVLGSGDDWSGLGEAVGQRFSWSGTVSLPEVEDVELLVLIEGGAAGEYTSGQIVLGGQQVKPRRVTSAGQFGAASDASPDNWLWLIAPLPKGATRFQLDLRLPSDQMAVGVYVRGTMRAQNDAAPADATVFPVFRPDTRAWSQTLLPLTPVEATP